MPEMTRRLQILLDERRYALLERAARRSGASVAALVRDAVEQVYGEPEQDRQAAVERFLSAEPVPVADWADEKRELRDEFYGRSG